MKNWEGAPSEVSRKDPVKPSLTWSLRTKGTPWVPLRTPQLVHLHHVSLPICGQRTASKPPIPNQSSSLSQAHNFQKITFRVRGIKPSLGRKEANENPRIMQIQQSRSKKKNRLTRLQRRKGDSAHLCGAHCLSGKKNLSQEN